MPDVSLKRRGWSVEYVDDVRAVSLEHGYDDEGQLDGNCFPRERLILIDSEIEGVVLLETEVHELTHGLAFDLPEERVKAFARDLARALWKLGWRCAPRRSQG